MHDSDPSLRDLFDACIDLPAERRAAYLDAHCADPARRDMLERLGHKCLSATTRERGLSLAKKAEIDACVISDGRFDALDDDAGRARLSAFVAALNAGQPAPPRLIALLPAGDQAEALQALGITALILPPSPESLSRALTRVSAQ